MPLFIQDPSDTASDYLVDKLLNACDGAVSGGGAFAFLSAGGVQLLLRDASFVEFTRHGHFDLVIGADAITDTAAVAALDEARAVSPNIEASVHLPRHPRSIFHPKLAWFRKPDGGVLITGSGNLTAGGLRWNIEAFHVTELDAAGIDQVAHQWAEYKIRCAESLLSTDDPRVIALLARNAEHRQHMRARGRDDEAETEEVESPEPNAGAPEAEPVDVDAVPVALDASDVLVAEIPRSGDRWKQVNFDIGTFINFFGASTTVARNAYFFHVQDDGTVGNQEVRPAVTVASQNYRFELDAASGKIYPSVGRPIGVFVRVAVRTFTYMLLMPNDPTHGQVLTLLNNVNPHPGNRMRRIVFSAIEVRNVWPTSPLWNQLTL